MCRVRSAATARKISGEAIVSQPVLWCSPTQASSKPSSSSLTISSRSRSRARVGFSPGSWYGAMKTPKRIRTGRVYSVPGERPAILPP